MSSKVFYTPEVCKEICDILAHYPHNLLEGFSEVSTKFAEKDINVSVGAIKTAYYDSKNSHLYKYVKQNPVVITTSKKVVLIGAKMRIEGVTKRGRFTSMRNKIWNYLKFKRN